MKVTENPNPPAGVEIHPAARIGRVHYTVADLSRQVDFYQERLGFKLHWREGDSAGLGAGGDDLLQLTEVRGARTVRGTTGLYHTAFLFPTRLSLAQTVLNIAKTRTPIQGGSNHGTHEALYLADAEDNGIELAWDFPRQVWEPLVVKMRSGNLRELMNIMRQPLDTDGLLEEAQHATTPWTGLPEGSSVGHVHLHVADLEETERFYRGVLGFETMMNEPKMGAVFFAAGGYHHHIGTNVWNGRGAPPPPADATGLRDFTVVLPDQREVERVLERVRTSGGTVEGERVRDPAGNGIRLAAEAV